MQPETKPRAAFDRRRRQRQRSIHHEIIASPMREHNQGAYGAARARARVTKRPDRGHRSGHRHDPHKRVRVRKLEPERLHRDPQRLDAHTLEPDNHISEQQ
eukprot:Amastigsp_a509153_13.p4 type:complete len:101 gc:universal Amastigsp_a509153_13:422-724(+)